jgi:hypothetical protein
MRSLKEADGTGVLTRYVKETGCEVVDWIHVAQDRVQWWAVVNRVMNIGVP